MLIRCVRCEVEFESPEFRGYCDGCVQAHREARKAVHAKQRPAPGVCADGKFADPATCPRTVLNPLSQKAVCPLCGSDDIQPGYGFGGGYGMGIYNFCCGCNTFLDFCEDAGE